LHRTVGLFSLLFPSFCVFLLKYTPTSNAKFATHGGGDGDGDGEHLIRPLKEAVAVNPKRKQRKKQKKKERDRKKNRYSYHKYPICIVKRQETMKTQLVKCKCVSLGLILVAVPELALCQPPFSSRFTRLSGSNQTNEPMTPNHP
jgi:hypothetical protein